MIRNFCVVMVFLFLCLPVGLRLGGYESVRLNGVYNEVTQPKFSLDEFINGDYQKNFTTFFNQQFALRDVFVKTTNQLYYDLFAKSYMNGNSMVIGRDNSIFEKYYLDDYIVNNMKPDEIAEVADDIVYLQQKLMEHGKMFCVVITPTKVRTMPETVPEQYAPYIKEGYGSYDRLIAALQEHEVDFIDGQAILLADKQQNGRLLFTQGGTHWNEYGTSLMIDAMYKFLNERYDTALVMPELVSLTEDMQPTYDKDSDLYELLNLWRPAKFKASHPQWAVNLLPGKQKYSMAIVGGSFCWNITDVAQLFGQFEPIDVYYYYFMGNVHFSDGQREERPVLSSLEEDAAAWRNALLAHDVIFLEINGATPLSATQKFLAAARKFL